MGKVLLSMHGIPIPSQYLDMRKETWGKFQPKSPTREDSLMAGRFMDRVLNRVQGRVVDIAYSTDCELSCHHRFKSPLTVQDLFINIDNGNTIIHLENFEVLNG